MDLISTEGLRHTPQYVLPLIAHAVGMDLISTEGLRLTAGVRRPAAREHGVGMDLISTEGLRPFSSAWIRLSPMVVGMDLISTEGLRPDELLHGMQDRYTKVGMDLISTEGLP